MKIGKVEQYKPYNYLTDTSEELECKTWVNILISFLVENTEIENDDIYKEESHIINLVVIREQNKTEYYNQVVEFSKDRDSKNMYLFDIHNDYIIVYDIEDTGNYVEIEFFNPHNWN